MFRILKLVLLAAAANCAPATLIPLAAPLAQPYFFIQPQNSFQYQPLLRLQQPVAPETKIETPKNQYIFLYPTAPQAPLLALRQDESGGPDFFQQINNWWSDFSQNFGQGPAAEAPPMVAGSTPDMKMEKPMLDKRIDLMPASTMPLNMNKQRFYLLNSLPQFYGNFAALPTVAISNPILARSSVDSIPAETEQIDKIRSPDVVEMVQQPAVVQPIPQLQLRSNIVEPLQRLEINQPQIPLVNNEPVVEVAAQQVARILDEARSQDADPNNANILNENEANKLRSEGEIEEENQSIAQAKPSGIALSGKGGLSSSSPLATAVVGEGGLALAAPSAISLSGDFDDEAKKMEQ